MGTCPHKEVPIMQLFKNLLSPQPQLYLYHAHNVLVKAITVSSMQCVPMTPPATYY